MGEGKHRDQLMWRRKTYDGETELGWGGQNWVYEAESEQTLVAQDSDGAGELSQTRTASHGFRRESGQEVWSCKKASKSHMVVCLFTPRVLGDVTWQ